MRPVAPVRDTGADAAELVARVAQAKRPVLLRAYRGRLGEEDLADCLQQATFELVRATMRGEWSPQDEPHAANALEHKLRLRIVDVYRARGRAASAGLVEAADEHGDLPDVADTAVDLDELARTRHDLRVLREVACELRPDERRLIAGQALDMSRADICRRFDWSVEKYKSLARRAVGKLRVLVAEVETGERCERLRPLLHEVVVGLAEPEDELRLREHLDNCPACARLAADLRRARNELAEVLPLPLVMAVAGAAGAGGLGVWTLLRLKLAGALGGGGAAADAATSAGTAGAGGAAALAGGKLVAACVAGSVCVAGIGAVATGVVELPHGASPPAHKQAPHVTAASHPKVVVAGARSVTQATRSTPKRHTTSHTARVRTPATAKAQPGGAAPAASGTDLNPGSGPSGPAGNVPRRPAPANPDAIDLNP